MDFNEIDALADAISENEDEREVAEYILTQAADFGTKYEKTMYQVPFAAINLKVVHDSLVEVRHPALIQRRTEKFSADEFPEFAFGESDEQPNFSVVFAEYMNFLYATTTHSFLAALEKAGKVTVTLGVEGFEYHVAEGAEDTKDINEAVDYGNIFL